MTQLHSTQRITIYKHGNTCYVKAGAQILRKLEGIPLVQLVIDRPKVVRWWKGMLRHFWKQFDL